MSGMLVVEQPLPTPLPKTMTTTTTATTRPSGCAGIFFQLLDWNRRIAKKKLLPRKLLTPVRASRRGSKSFCKDDKMPKSAFKLVHVENSRDLPIAKKRPRSSPSSSSNTNQLVGLGGRTPGLIARLMGLDSIPIDYNESSRKAYCSRTKKDNVSTESPGNGNLKSRIQNVQKTSEFSKQIRSNVDLLHCKKTSKLSLPGKKSPRMLSRRSSACLIDAASKILEPGMQTRSKLKFAITYIDSNDSRGKSRTNILNLLEVSKPKETVWEQPCVVVSEGLGMTFSSSSDGNCEPARKARLQSSALPLTIRAPKTVAERAFGSPEDEVFATQGQIAASISDSRIRNPSNSLGIKDCGKQQSKRDLNGCMVGNLSDCIVSGARQGGGGSSERVMVRKRQSTSSLLPEIANMVFQKPKTDRRKVVNRKRDVTSSFGCHRCVRSENLKKQHGDDVVSFSKNSLNCGTDRPLAVEKKKNQTGRFYHSKELEEPDITAEISPCSSRKSLRGDALSNLLEQKLQDLSLLVSNQNFGSSTDTIHEDVFCPDFFYPTDISYETISYKSDNSTTPAMKEDVKSELYSELQSCENDKPSPVSILEASFSNDGSLSESNVSGLGTEFIMSQKRLFQSLDLEMEIIDSATSAKATIEDSSRSHEISPSNPAFPAAYLKEALVLRIFEDLAPIFHIGADSRQIGSSFTEQQMGGSRISPSLLLDCVAECVDSRLEELCCSGYTAWSQIHGATMDADLLASQVREELIIWKDFAGEELEDVTAAELRDSSAKWTKFYEAEAFEAGVEIENQIMESLVGDTTVDLLRHSRR